MRLRLIAKTETGDPEKKGWRLLERGELTLGRDPACQWTLPDPDRRISKVHCRIRRDAAGFTVTDESTNGLSVDRRELAQGETVRLQNGSAISFCDHRFQVEITGEIDPDWTDPDARYALGDDVPSITAILSDVSAGGTTATGILPASDRGEDWLAELGDSEKGTVHIEKPASRPDIGWAGAPDPGITGGGALPEDWDTEAATSTRAEHAVATTTRMRLPRAGGDEPPASREAAPASEGASASDAMEAFFAAAGERAWTGSGDPVAALAAAGRSLGEARRALRDLSRELEDFLDEAGDERGGRRDPAFADDAAGLLLRQRVLLSATRELLLDVDRLAPAEIELRARLEDASQTGLTARLPVPGRAERALVALYRRAYEGEEGGGPRGRFLKRLQGEAGDAASDDFEELSADRPRSGDGR